RTTTRIRSSSEGSRLVVMTSRNCPSRKLRGLGQRKRAAGPLPSPFSPWHAAQYRPKSCGPSSTVAAISAPPEETPFAGAATPAAGAAAGGADGGDAESRDWPHPVADRSTRPITAQAAAQVRVRFPLRLVRWGGPSPQPAGSRDLV